MIYPKSSNSIYIQPSYTSLPCYSSPPIPRNPFQENHYKQGTVPAHNPPPCYPPPVDIPRPPVDPKKTKQKFIKLFKQVMGPTNAIKKNKTPLQFISKESEATYKKDPAKPVIYLERKEILGHSDDDQSVKKYSLDELATKYAEFVENTINKFRANTSPIIKKKIEKLHNNPSLDTIIYNLHLKQLSTYSKLINWNEYKKLKGKGIKPEVIAIEVAYMLESNGLSEKHFFEWCSKTPNLTHEPSHKPPQTQKKTSPFLLSVVRKIYQLIKKLFAESSHKEYHV
jgi:hypothetical protein